MGEVPATTEAPSILYSVVGSIAWDGTPHFRLPGQAALFQPDSGRLWVRGQLPQTVRAITDPGPGAPCQARPLWSWEAYATAVREAQAAMADGTIRKVILSVPFAAPCDLPPETVLARFAADTAPGIAFLLPDGDGWLIGRSPEPLVLLEERRATIHLLAGTRAAEADLETDLTANPKDKAEHMIAVEQSRADLLAVCEPESVLLERCMAVERHPGLIHLASRLVGRLRPDASPADLVRACFPAGTVGGVPRAAAGELIERLEPLPRDWYAGAVGLIMPGGDLQLWLTIRSLRLAGGQASLRTGAGLVAESQPEAEWQECMNKARRQLAAIGAEVSQDDRA